MNEYWNGASAKQLDAERDFKNAAYDISKRQVYRRKPKKASDLISHFLARTGVGNQESSHQLQGAWDSIVGGSIANCCRVASLRRGVLEVTVSNSSVSHQLSFRKQEILAELKKQFPQENIGGLRFRIGAV